MEEIDFQQGSFNAQFKTGYVSVHPEMKPEANGISSTGRYFVYYLHPVKGSCTFIVEQNEYCKWIAQIYPPFIDQILIDWIGDKIESSNT